MSNYTPQAGTVIHATLRDEDLIPAFLGELELIDPERAKSFEGRTDEDTVSDLIDALNEEGPDHLYFGNTEGDGSDFGWWYVEDHDESVE